MLGLLGTVAGAAALEIKRLHKRGSVEELRETKKRERELKKLLEATHRKLEKVRLHSEAVEEKASQMESKAESLEHEKEQLQQQAAEMGQQREQLQQNNSKLLITNLLLLNKTRQLEDHSRALVAKQEDLQHQLEQLQREHVAAEANFEASLAALKDQVTGVLNRYFSKDIDLQHAIGEMQQMGIEVVPADDMARMPEDTMDFQTKLVLDSPHRMQRLMSRQLSQITAGLPHDSEIPRLAQYSFPLGIGKDPTTGAPRITLGWRTDPQAHGSLSGRASSSIDVQPQLADQQEASSSKKAQLAIKDTCSSSDNGKMQQANGSSKAATVQDGPAGAALTFASPQKTKVKQHSSPFSLPSFSSLGFRTSSNGSSGPMAKAAKGSPVIGNASFKGNHHDDMFMANTKDLVSRKH